MTLESILYLLFGFLIAVFLALILIPAVWNRAVYLTERKVKSSMPFNPREIEAEKDALRAEHAMTVRRLELAISELREKASTHIAELHSKRDELNRLKLTSLETQENLSSLEQAAEQMRGKLADLHEKNTSMSGEFQKTAEALEKLKSKHKELVTRNSANREELSRSRVDLIAKDGKIESLSATLDTLNLTDDAKAVKVKELTDEVAALKKQIDEQRKQSKLLKKNTRALEKQLSKASTETEASVLENSKEFANERKELETRILDLGEELMQERTRSIELEAELARQALNREISNSQTLAASSDNSSQPIDELKQMSEEISAELKVLAKKKPTQKEKNDLRESIRTLGSKTSSIA